MTRFALFKPKRAAQTKSDPPPNTRLRAASAISPVNSIFLVTIPKSGTVYMNAMFCNGLGLQNFHASNRYFPDDQINLDVMPEFVKGGYFASSHIDPSAANLQILDHFVPRWIVHFRDPRSVLLSWVHHVRKLGEAGEFVNLLRVAPTPPPDVLNAPLEQTVAWHIEHMYPAVLNWMSKWLRVAEQNPSRILITEYTQLCEDEQGIADRMIDFVEFDKQAYVHNPPAKTMAAHFRTGTYDEWKSSFTPAQVAQCSSMISRDLRERFPWPE